jgi:uncharacterized SAM-binding protein YcdF (DUF218 family)
MFQRKYIFETRSTRFRRLLASALVLLVLSLAITTTFIVYIPIYARMQKGRAAGAFFQKSPDAIAVFTGDKGRIAYALEITKRNPSAKLFISGVYAANSFQTLIEKQGTPETGEELEGAGTQVDLDYDSKNTYQNVRETLEFLKGNPQLNKVLIISSDYHIMRVNLLMSHFIKGSKPEIYFDSVTHQFATWKEIRKLLKESVKLARTFLILKILREDLVQDND